MLHLRQLRTGSGTYLILRSRDRTATGAALQLIATNLQQWLANPLSRSIIAEVTRELGGGSVPPSRALNASDLHRQTKSRLEQAIRCGDLLVVQVSGMGRGGAGGEEPGAPPQAAAQAPRRAEPRKTWIEIELVDDQGRPVPNQRCSVELPDGTTWTGVLDANGLARVDYVDHGTCEVYFPDLDYREWAPAS